MQNNKNQVQICPLCGEKYHGVPALSRDDNRTLICPDCGTRQSLESIGIAAEEIEKILSIIRRNCPE